MHKCTLLIILIAFLFTCSENKNPSNSNNEPEYCNVYGNIQYVQENEDYTFAWTTDNQKADMLIKWTMEDKNTKGYWRNRTLANVGFRLKNITLSVAIESIEPDFYVRNITMSDDIPGCK